MLLTRSSGLSCQAQHRHRHHQPRACAPRLLCIPARLHAPTCRALTGGGSAEDAATDDAASSASITSSRVLQTDPVQLCELLSRLAQLQVKPHQPWLADVLDTLQPRLLELSTGQLSSTLQVLGGWGYMPSEPFMQALQAAVRQQVGSVTMRHIANMAWGLAQLQNPRQPLLDELLQAALALMQDKHCSAANIAAAQQQQQEQDGCQLQQQQQGQGQPSHPACCPASLADLVWSVAKLQHNPGSAWLATFAATSRPLLSTFTPHQLAQVSWAFARLPYQPSSQWMDSFLDAVRDRLRDFDGASVSLTAWGLATLKAQPDMRWLFAFERQVERTLSTLAASELACTLWALSELKNKRADKLRLGRLVRRQEVFWGFDYEALANPRLLRVVRQLTLGPTASRS